MFFSFIQTGDRDFQASTTADAPVDVIATPPAVEPWSELGRMGLAGCDLSENEINLRRLGLLAGRGPDETPRWM